MPHSFDRPEELCGRKDWRLVATRGGYRRLKRKRAGAAPGILTAWLVAPFSQRTED
jgi:hypothetical protein